MTQATSPSDATPAAEQARSGTVTAVIVSYDSQADEIRAAIDSLLAQARAPIEIFLVDNGTDGALASELDGYSPRLRTIASHSNIGYGAAINLAASASASEYILCMNPDARAEAGCIEALAAVADSEACIAIVGAQVLMSDGVTRNAGPNPLHPTGISTSGGYGERRELAPARTAAVVSGACCLIRRASLLALGGFLEELFLYYEDVDLAWRARIAGMSVVYCPDACVLHDYEFARRKRKWFLLERNRLFCVLANYEVPTLILLAPMLLATELGVLAAALLGGWIWQKLSSYASLVAMRHKLLAQRRVVRESRRCSDLDLMRLFSDRLDSPLLPARARGVANVICVPYLRLLRRLLSVTDAHSYSIAPGN